MNHRDQANAERITVAFDTEEESYILVHAYCAAANPETVLPWNGDYEFEDGTCCVICGADLLTEVDYKTLFPSRP